MTTNLTSFPANLRTRAAKAGVPSRFLAAAWPLPDNLANWEPKGFTYIFGSVGSGKTTAAARLFVERCLPAGAGLWTTAAWMVASIQSGYSKGNAFDVLSEYCEAKHLVIDDLGSVVSEDAKAKLGMVIDDRWSNSRCTIITSNLSIKQLRDAFDDRMASRIADKVNLVAELVTNDHRRSDARTTALAEFIEAEEAKRHAEAEEWRKTLKPETAEMIEALAAEGR